MTDRILTESPWNALFDNLPGIAQQVNQAMMERKQQQLDQQNVERQFGQRRRELELREDQLDETERHNQILEENTLLNVIARNKSPMEIYKISVSGFPHRFTSEALGEMKVQGDRYEEVELKISTADTMDKATALLNDPYIFQHEDLRRSAQFKLGQTQRTTVKGIVEPGLEAYTGSAIAAEYSEAPEFEAGMINIRSLMETGDYKGALRAYSKFATTYGVPESQAGLDVDAIEAGKGKTKEAGWSWSKNLMDIIGLSKEDIEKRKARQKAEREARKRR